MARPYSRKTKKDAIAICELMASNDRAAGYAEVLHLLGVKLSSTAVRLAEEAWDAVASKVDLAYGEVYAEAAALIRSGWMIGDDIELLPQPNPTLEAILKRNYPAEAITEAAFAPNPIFALIKTETAAAHASMDAKEADLDTYGYGGDPTVISAPEALTPEDTASTSDKPEDTGADW